MLKFDGAFLLGAALLTPVSVKTLHADDEHRYYDKEHKDYHAWNEGEEHAWRRYWEEQHRPYVSWEKAKEKERQEYWHWRHEHPDHDEHRDERH